MFGDMLALSLVIYNYIGVFFHLFTVCVRVTTAQCVYGGPETAVGAGPFLSLCGSWHRARSYQPWGLAPLPTHLYLPSLRCLYS